jgi:predicted kinase
LYSATATRHTYDALADLARQALSRGDSVVLDASFAKQAERRRMAMLAREMGAHCCVVECRAPEAALRARLRQREHSPASISDAREEILSQFLHDYEPLHADEGICCVHLDTTQSIDQCVQQALAGIHEQRP